MQRSLLFFHCHQPLNVIVRAIGGLIKMSCRLKRQSNPLFHQKKNFIAQDDGELLCLIVSQNSVMSVFCWSPRTSHILLLGIIWLFPHSWCNCCCRNSTDEIVIRKGKAFHAHIMKACRRRRGITPLILNLDIRWRWVDNFMPCLLYPQERNLLFTEWARWAYEPLWVLWRIEKSVTLAEIKNSDHLASSLFAILTVLPKVRLLWWKQEWEWIKKRGVGRREECV